MRNGKLHVGEWVEVRRKEEILKTLDRKGQLNGLPFMPQMFEFCGRRLRVYKRAHKTCDTVNDYKGRWMDSAVHLEGIRCDGQAYGGCQAACLIYWKEAWLKRAAEPYSPDSSSSKAPRELASTSGITQGDVWAGTKAAFNENPNDPVYVCQATQVPAATQPLPWWDIRQYIEDWTSGNVGLSRMARGFLYMGFRDLQTVGIDLGRGFLFAYLYDISQRFLGGVPFPRRTGKIPLGSKTPTICLNLQPGEWVRVKSYKEILATLDTNNKNRGLYFDAEMVPMEPDGVVKSIQHIGKSGARINGGFMVLRQQSFPLHSRW